MQNKKSENIEKQKEKMEEKPQKYLIQMIDRKDDVGMTRIYSAIYKTEPTNPHKK